MTIVQYPRGMFRVRNMLSIAAPSTTSGAATLANSSSVTEPEPRNRYLPSAMPTSVPSTVAMAVATAAMVSEVTSASVRL